MHEGIEMYTLKNGDSVSAKDGKAALKRSATTIRKAIAQERKSALVVGRELASVKASGLAGILLSSEQREAAKTADIRSAFALWCDGLGITPTQRSRYLAHAAVVDSLVENDHSEAEAFAPALTRALAKAAKTEYAENVTEALETMTSEGYDLAADTVNARFGSSGSGKGKTPKTMNIGEVVTAILRTAESSLPSNYGTLSVEDIDKAVGVIQEWAANAHALLSAEAE